MMINATTMRLNAISRLHPASPPSGTGDKVASPGTIRGCATSAHSGRIWRSGGKSRSAFRPKPLSAAAKVIVIAFQNKARSRDNGGSPVAAECRKFRDGRRQRTDDPHRTFEAASDHPRAASSAGLGFYCTLSRSVEHNSARPADFKPQRLGVAFVIRRRRDRQ